MNGQNELKSKNTDIDKVKTDEELCSNQQLDSIKASAFKDSRRAGRKSIKDKLCKSLRRINPIP